MSEEGPGEAQSCPGWEEAEQALRGPSKGPWDRIMALAKLHTCLSGQEVLQSPGEQGPRLPGLGCWISLVLLPYMGLMSHGFRNHQSESHVSTGAPQLTVLSELPVPTSPPEPGIDELVCSEH